MPQPVISNITMDGSEKTFTFNDETYAAVLHARGGDITVMMSTGGTPFTLTSGNNLNVNTRSIQNQTWYFDGEAGTLEIIEMRGLQ